jgi:hypothetical protein
MRQKRGEIVRTLTIAAIPTATGMAAANPYASARIAGSAERMSRRVYE